MTLAREVKAEVFVPNENGELLKRSVSLPAGVLVRTPDASK
jgi:hypothetical protein